MSFVAHGHLPESSENPTLCRMILTRRRFLGRGILEAARNGELSPQAGSECPGGWVLRLRKGRLEAAGNILEKTVPWRG